MKRQVRPAKSASDVDWKTFQLILISCPTVFVVVALLADSWITAIMLISFGLAAVCLVFFRQGRSRAITLHTTIALLLTYQTVLLSLTVDEPNIGLVWFLSVPAMVALLGNRYHIVIWTPISCGLLWYCWSLYAANPSMAHPMSLPNLIGVTLVISVAAWGVVVQRDRREEALTEALDAATVEAQRRKTAEQEASEASAAITAFLGSMSHELRTPLTSIVLAADVLEACDPSESPEDRREWAGNIRDSAQSLVLLLNDVLDLARSDAGSAALNTQPFDVEELLVSIRAILRPMAADKGMRLIVSAMPDVPANWSGDATRIRQVLVNLVNNALQHSGGSWVWLRISYNNAALEFAVTDNGRGIPPDAQRSIFQPFNQLSHIAGGADKTGTGLGLTIARGYVEAMDGELILSSEPGKGACFQFSLNIDPVSAMTLRGTHPPSAHWPKAVNLMANCPQMKLWCERWLEAWDISLDAKAAALLPDEPPGIALGSLSLLKTQLDALGAVAADANSEPDTPALAASLQCVIVDDNAQICRVVCEVLGRAGHTAVSFSCSGDLLAYIVDHHVDVIILDVNLVGESGLDVLKILRGLPAPASTVAVCMLSGSMEHREQCVSAGADDYLLKPIGSEAMIQMVETLASPARRQGNAIRA